ncbi:hypothetical protein Hypma_013225 [Hypsizygus marmoreus]|uniref:Uncharacterized protein n=1 Tax=Hypsizygus marmoreus TaxID=39966 RepID=A0A369JEX5_HYPMA|nr:hypothetical protein Hypma_013225 [Hypsizygus marmoreus]
MFQVCNDLRLANGDWKVQRLAVDIYSNWFRYQKEGIKQEVKNESDIIKGAKNKKNFADSAAEESITLVPSQVQPSTPQVSGTFDADLVVDSTKPSSLHAQATTSTLHPCKTDEEEATSETPEFELPNIGFSPPVNADVGPTPSPVMLPKPVTELSASSADLSAGCAAESEIPSTSLGAPTTTNGDDHQLTIITELLIKTDPSTLLYYLLTLSILLVKHALPLSNSKTLASPATTPSAPLFHYSPASNSELNLFGQDNCKTHGCVSKQAVKEAFDLLSPTEKQVWTDLCTARLAAKKNHKENVA